MSSSIESLVILSVSVSYGNLVTCCAITAGGKTFEYETHNAIDSIEESNTRNGYEDRGKLHGESLGGTQSAEAEEILGEDYLDVIALHLEEAANIQFGTLGAMIQASSEFKSEYGLTCEFADVLKDGSFPTITQCDKFDEYALNDHFVCVLLDCATGKVYCSSETAGLTKDMASGHDQYWELPKLAAKKIVHELLCSAKVIDLLEDVYFGTEESENGDWIKDDDAQAAFDRLTVIFETQDKVCDLEYCSNEE